MILTLVSSLWFKAHVETCFFVCETLVILKKGVIVVYSFKLCHTALYCFMLVGERLVESYKLLSSPPDIKGIVHTNENSLIVYSVCVCVWWSWRGGTGLHICMWSTCDQCNKRTVSAFSYPNVNVQFECGILQTIEWLHIMEAFDVLFCWFWGLFFFTFEEVAPLTVIALHSAAALFTSRTRKLQLALHQRST